MKRLIIITSFIFFSSCTRTVENHQEIENLQSKISALEVENKKLKDSLLKNEEDVLFRHLIGIPETQKQQVGKKNKIVMLLHDFDKKLPEYKIFRVVNNKKIKVGESNKTIFDYEFTPTSTKDNSPEFIVRLPYKGKYNEISGKLILDIEK
ncbi:MAG: hypothetical protein KA278_01995 [Flavobacterium sp.]|nr:hypothetical protein [Flavobacterium sp.]